MSVSRKRPVVDCSKFPSRTKQYFKAECDINAIVRRAAESGQLPVRRGAMFQDVVGLQMDYQEAMNFVMDAGAKFWALPPDLRMRFKNDVGALLKFVDDPANQAECVKLGLLPAQETPSQSVPPEQSKGNEAPPVKEEPKA